MSKTAPRALIALSVLIFAAMGADAKGYDERLVRLPEGCQERACYCPRLESGIRAALAEELRAAEKDLLQTIHSKKASSEQFSAHFAANCDTATVVFRPTKTGKMEVLRYSSAFRRGSAFAHFLTRISLSGEIRGLRSQPFSFVPVTGRLSIPMKYMPKTFKSPADIDQPGGALFTEMRAKLANPELPSFTQIINDRAEISLSLQGDGRSLARSLEYFKSEVNFGLVGDIIRKLGAREWDTLTPDAQKEKMLALLNECAIQGAANALKTAGRAAKDISLTHYVLRNGVVGYCADYLFSSAQQGKGAKSVSLDALDTVILHGRPLSIQEANQYTTREMADTFGKFIGGIARGISENSGGD